MKSKIYLVFIEECENETYCGFRYTKKDVEDLIIEIMNNNDIKRDRIRIVEEMIDTSLFEKDKLTFCDDYTMTLTAENMPKSKLDNVIVLDFMGELA